MSSKNPKLTTTRIQKTKISSGSSRIDPSQVLSRYTRERISLTTIQKIVTRVTRYEDQGGQLGPCLITQSLPLKDKLEEFLTLLGYEEALLASFIVPLLTKGKVQINIGDRVERIELVSSKLLSKNQAEKFLEDYLKTIKVKSLPVPDGKIQSLSENSASRSKIRKFDKNDTQRIQPLSVNNAALLRAVIEDHTATASILLRDGADVNTRLPDGWTPLMYAAWSGYTNMVKALLAYDADLEAKGGNGWTALMVAVWGGHMSTIETLVSAGANVNAKDNNNKTVLMWAAQKGSVSVVQLLLEKEANVHAKNNKGATPLAYALREKHTAVSILLKKAGGN